MPVVNNLQRLCMWLSLYALVTASLEHPTPILTGSANVLTFVKKVKLLNWLLDLIGLFTGFVPIVIDSRDFHNSR